MYAVYCWKITIPDDKVIPYNEKSTQGSQYRKSAYSKSISDIIHYWLFENLYAFVHPINIFDLLKLLLLTINGTSTISKNIFFNFNSFV